MSAASNKRKRARGKRGRDLFQGGVSAGDEWMADPSGRRCSPGPGEADLSRGVSLGDAARGIQRSSVLLTATLTTALSVLPVHESNMAFAGPKGSTLRVAVTVPAICRFSQFFQIPVIILSDADIHRGYIDIQGATRFTIQNNNESGYLLLFEGLEKPFKEVLVHGLTYDIQIDSKAAFIHQPYFKTTTSAELSYRFFLTENASAGEYPWPLSITIQPAF